MRVSLSITLTIIFIFSLIIAVHSETTRDQKFALRVSVSVNGDMNLCDTVQNGLTEELRSLHDVRVVDTDFHWLLGIIAHELSTTIGYKTGTILSGVVIKKSNIWDEMQDSQNNRCNSELTATLYGCEGHWIRVVSNNDIKEICKEIIKNFDKDYLEKDRKFFQRSREMRKFR